MEVNPKVLEGVEHVYRFSYVLKESEYINWDTLELNIWIPDHYIDTSNFTLCTKKNTKPMPSLVIDNRSKIPKL